MEEDEKKPVDSAEEGEPEEPKAEWKYKTEMGINSQMKDVVQKTIDVCNLELASLHRKLKKLTYGG